LSQLLLGKSARLNICRAILHLGCLMPLFYTYSLAISDELGADPVEAIIHFTGIGALNILLLTLCISPLSKRIQQLPLLKLRRPLGIWVFVYAFCHLFSFLAFEAQFDWALFVGEIIERPYIWVGMLSFLLLAALTVTSISNIKRKMGKRWQQLHNFVYLILLLTIWHYYWSVKLDVTSPAIYLLLAFILLSFRQNKFKRLSHFVSFGRNK